MDLWQPQYISYIVSWARCNLSEARKRIGRSWALMAFHPWQSKRTRVILFILDAMVNEEIYNRWHRCRAQRVVDAEGCCVWEH